LPIYPVAPTTKTRFFTKEINYISRRIVIHPFSEGDAPFESQVKRQQQKIQDFLERTNEGKVEANTKRLKFGIKSYIDRDKVLTSREYGVGATKIDQQVKRLLSVS
jgi:hypothetical protein